MDLQWVPQQDMHFLIRTDTHALSELRFCASLRPTDSGWVVVIHKEPCSHILDGELDVDEAKALTVALYRLSHNH